MPHFFFVSDLHGKLPRYSSLLAAIEAERPSVVLLGGDLLPHPMAKLDEEQIPDADFLGGWLAPRLAALRRQLGDDYPEMLLILGNDDARAEEEALRGPEQEGLWRYINERRVEVAGRPVYGYAFCPPSPFQLKDFEKYDVSRFVDPGSLSPEEGARTVPLTADEARYGTIKDDLEALAGEDDLERAVFLFHSPPYQTKLDRADLDGKMIDYAPLDVHVGSIAIKRFIETRQPRVTLHGHVHESPRLTDTWKQRIGRTWALTAAHDGPELALVRFDPASPEEATRELI